MTTAAPEKRKRSALFWVIVACAALGCAGLGAAILLVIATPAIARSIENAKEAACAAEMRGVYQELISYRTMYGGAATLDSWWGEKLDSLSPSPPYDWRVIQSFPLERFHCSVRVRLVLFVLSSFFYD